MIGSIIIIININNKERLCNVCGKPAHVMDKNKWWCGLDFHTAHGFCKNQKGRDGKSYSN